MKVERILFPTDFSEQSKQSLVYALQLAGALDAELHLLHATVLHDYKGIDPFPAYQVFETALTDRVKTMLQDMARNVDGSAVRIRRVERRGLAAAPTILDYADEVGIDLIVMATHGRRGVRKAFLGSVAQEVVRHAPMPVLTVRGRATLGNGAPARLLAAVDFSSMTHAVIDASIDLARRIGAEVTLIHAVELPASNLLGHGEREVAEAHGRVVAQAETRLKDEAKRLRERDVTCRVEVAHGPAVQAIAEAAERLGSDLIVVGSHHHTTVDRFLIGSVSERIVQRSERPVLTLKSPSVVERESPSHRVAM